MKNLKIAFIKHLSLFCSMAILIVFSSCSNDDKDDDPDPVNEVQVLVEYLESGAGSAVSAFPVMIKSTDVNSGVLTPGTNNYIIDIRAAEDFDAGHIEGAVNVAAGDVLSHYETNGLESYDNVILVCYSGQTAGWVNGLMHTLGYTNCKDMKWGMSSWNESTSGPWKDNIGNTYATSLVTTAASKATPGDLPSLETGETGAQDILRARVEAVFAEGFGQAKVSSSEVFDNTDGYYIVNYWKQEDYDWGHIPGAIQYEPKASLTSDTFLETLPTDMPIVVYCYTGQTSAHIAAYLRVLGYDAKSLVYGVNGMAHDDMPGTKFEPTTEIHDYALVGNSVNEAQILVEYLESGAGSAVNTFPVMIKSTDVNSLVLVGADSYIIDIRSAEDFQAGHIEGSVNVAAGDVLAHYEANNLETYETVIIACYSGQTAGWVNGLMHTMGYTNCKDMKWGMCSWNSQTSGSWMNSIGNTYATSLVTTAASKAAAGDLPKLETGETVAQDILRARVEAVFAEGFGQAKVSNTEVFGNTDGYYIVNYWKQEDYDWGHIPGAIQYEPKASLTSDTFLNTLPTDTPIVVYCYTGQTSAHVAAYLRVLGYDAKSLVFGVNGMAFDTMPGTRFVAETEVHEYELVTN